MAKCDAAKKRILVGFTARNSEQVVDSEIVLEKYQRELIWLERKTFVSLKRAPPWEYYKIVYVFGY